MLIIAHRGVHGPETPGVRENTLEAFRRAAHGAAAPGDPPAAHGAGPLADSPADGVELDVRRTADGVLVILHDVAAPGLGPVAILPAAALPGWVPTLAAALDACARLAFVDVEIKNSPFEPGFDPGTDLAAAVAATVLASPVASQAVLTSFHLDTVDAVRRAAPGLRTGWLTMPGYDQIQAVEVAARRGHAALAPPDRATSEQVVSVAHAAGLAVVVWTVDDAERMVELGGWGVDALVTDRPRLAGSVVR